MANEQLHGVLRHLQSLRETHALAEAVFGGKFGENGGGGQAGAGMVSSTPVRTRKYWTMASAMESHVGRGWSSPRPSAIARR